jgi:hypothetical protein
MIASGLAHRKTKLLIVEFAALLVLTSAVSIAAAQPKPTLEYVFSSSTNLAQAGGITDGSGNMYNGKEFSSATEASIGPGHLTSTFAIYFLGNEDTTTGGTGIDTSVDTKTVGIDGGPFTVMAWINRHSSKNDNMVFGTMNNGAPDLHLGFRKAQVQCGFWNNDSGAYAAVGIYEWHHWAIRYDGASKQDIFIDGVMINSDPGHAPYAGSGVNLTIGHTFGNGGAFCGAIEHPRVFGSQALRDDQIAADAADMSIPP